MIASRSIVAVKGAASAAEAGASSARPILRGVVLFAVCASIALTIQWNRIIPLSGAWGWGGDEGQMLWNLWVVHWNALHGLNPLVTDQIYFPVDTNLTHHSLASGYLPLTVLADLFSGHDPLYPFIALRLGIWLCHTLSLMFTYLVLRYLGHSLLEAAIPALGHAFCSFNEHHLHLTLLSGWLIPLDALMVLRWWRKPTPARATAAAFCFAIGVYFTEFSVFCVVALALAGIVVCCRRKGRQGLRQRLRATGLRGAAVACVVASATAAPFLITFAQADRVTLPDVQEHKNMSSDLLGPVVPTRMWHGEPATLLYGHFFEPLDAQVRTGNESFVGFPLLFLAAVGMLRWRQGPAVVKGAAVMALIFYVLMLGPTLHVLWHDTKIRMPYFLLMQVPPFNIQRAPVRMVVFLGFCLTIVAANGAARLRGKIAGTSAELGATRRRGRGRKLAGAVALTGMLTWVLAESYNPHTAYAAYQPPAALAELETSGAMSRAPVAALPILDADGYSEMLEIFHHRPILAGYLARLTPKQEEVCRALKEAYGKGPEAYSRFVKGRGAHTVLVAEGSGDYFYTPPCSFLADLAGRLRIVDLRSVKPRQVAEAGDPYLTNGEPCNAPGAMEVEGGKELLLRCPAPGGADRLELLSDANATFGVTLLRHGEPVLHWTALPTVKAPLGLQWRCFSFPTAVFDAVRIAPRGDRAFSTVGRLTAWAS